MERKRRSIREKLVDLFRDATNGAIEPRKIVVLPKRFSGPTLSPSDWYERDQQAKVMPQCALCHQRPLVSEAPLVRGLCAPCRVRLAESPEAA